MTAVRVIRVHREDPAIGPRATCDPDVRRVARDRLERRLAVTAALVVSRSGRPYVILRRARLRQAGPALPNLRPLAPHCAPLSASALTSV